MDVLDADMCLVEPEDNLLPYFDYLLSQPEEEPYWNSIFELISEFSADGHGVPADPLTLINPDLLYQTEENSEGLSESISSNYSPPPTLNSTPEPEPTSEEELITGQDCLPLANLDSLMEEEKYELLQFIATDLQEKLPNYVGTMWLMPSLRDLEEKTRHRYYRDTDSFLAYLHDLYENYDRHVTPNEKKNLMKHIHIIQFYLNQCANCYLNYYQYPKDWFLRPCLRHPHQIVLAKVEGFPCWPAKVMSVDFKSRTYKCAFFDKIRSHYDVPIASCSTITKDYAKTIGRPKKFIKQINESLRDLKIHLDYLKFYFPKTFTVAEKVEPCSVRTKLMIGDPEELPKLKHTYDQSEPFLRRYRTEIQLYHSKLDVAVEPVREYLKRKNIETE